MTFSYKGKTINIQAKYDGDYIAQQIINAQSFYQLSLLETLQSLYPKNEVILDCESNIGNHSVFFAEFLNANFLYAFNSINDNLGLTRKNLAPYKIAKVITAQQVITKNRDKKPTQKESNKIFESNDMKVFLIPIDTLYSNKNQKVTLIRFGQSDYLLMMLKGVIQTITKDLPALVITDNALPLINECLKILNPLGYSVLKEIDMDVKVYILESSKNPLSNSGGINPNPIKVVQ